MKILKTLALLLVATLLFPTPFAQAANPLRTIGYQGQLLNASGSPQTGTFDFDFKFYDSLSGGSQLGSTISKTLSISNGYVSVDFSEADLSGIDYNQVLYLEITVESTTLSPRALINSVAYSNATFGFISGSGAPTLSSPADGAAYFDTTANTLYIYDGASWTPVTGASSTTSFTQNGNAFGATAVIGTNDDNGLLFETNDLVRGGFDNAGLFFVGTSSASSTDPSTLTIKTKASTNPMMVLDSDGNRIFKMFEDGYFYSGLGSGNDSLSGLHSLFLGRYAGSASNANDSYFVGDYAGFEATNASNSIFIGASAGYRAANAATSNFIGAGAGYLATIANNSNFLGTSAGEGATRAANSNFLGRDAGAYAIDANFANFLGREAGNNAASSSYSNFLGYRAGADATNAANSIFIGRAAGYSDTVDNRSGNKSSILIGNYTSTGGFSNSISIGQGTQNTAVDQLNIGNVLYATGISSSSVSSGVALSGGRAGVGVEAPTTMFQVGKTGNEGNVTVYGTGTTCTIGNSTGATLCSSDKRLKHDINTAQGMLERVLELRPVSFVWNSDLHRGNEAKLGLIAQDVENIFPGYVSEVYDGYKGVDYAALVTPLIGSVQELNSKLTDSQTKIATLSEMIASVNNTSVFELLGDTYIAPKETDEEVGASLALPNDDFIGSVQKEDAPNVIEVFGKKIKEGSTFLTNFVTARVTALRGYFGEVFADKATLNELCLKDDSGTTCYTRDQLNKLVGVTEEPVIEIVKDVPAPVDTSPSDTPVDTKENIEVNTEEPVDPVDVETENPTIDLPEPVVSPKEEVKEEPVDAAPVSEAPVAEIAQ